MYLIIARFWGVFWIDASSDSRIEQGFQEIKDACELQHGAIKLSRWLSSSIHPWLLIFDNADDPALDMAQYFPTSNRGTVIITTRNPDCGIHSTVGSVKIDQLPLDEAETLLLRYADIEPSERLQSLASSIVTRLGCLALAIAQAGAIIRLGLCPLQDYCDELDNQRRRLLSIQAVQTSTEYERNVYTTWEISINRIRAMSAKVSADALELLDFFAFLHFDGITEDILREAWKAKDVRVASDKEDHNKGVSDEKSANVEDLSEKASAEFDLGEDDCGEEDLGEHDLSKNIFNEENPDRNNPDDENLGNNARTEQAPDKLYDLIELANGGVEAWDSQSFREAVSLLSSFSLISYDALSEQISMHPLVHTWARDRLPERDRKDLWLRAASTLAGSEFGARSLEAPVYLNSLRWLLPHGRSCLECTDSQILFEQNSDEKTLGVLIGFGRITASDLKTKVAVKLFKAALRLGETIERIRPEHIFETMFKLVLHYDELDQLEDALDLGEQTLARSICVLGAEHFMTLKTMSALANIYGNLGRKAEALQMA